MVSTRRTHTLHTTVLAPASCTGLRHHGSLRTPAHAASRWCDDRHNYATAGTYIVAPPAPRGTHALSLLCSENVWGAVWGAVLRHVWGGLCYVTCVGALCYVMCGALCYVTYGALCYVTCDASCCCRPPLSSVLSHTSPTPAPRQPHASPSATPQGRGMFPTFATRPLTTIIAVVVCNVPVLNPTSRLNSLPVPHTFVMSPRQQHRVFVVINQTLTET